MCGIVGIVKWNSIDALHKHSVELATQAMKHRGPDFQSVYSDENVAFGHARLSIIDLSPQANQPLWNTEKNALIVFNGEFFNYLSEKEILIKEGYQFNTQGDTEVLLQMYRHYGPHFIKRVNGCFSLAIYDIEQQSVYIARDRFGIKPLYISNINNTLVFASDLKAIQQIYQNLKIDTIALHSYFRFNYIPTYQTIFEGFERMPQGTYRIFNKQEEKTFVYYNLEQKTVQHKSYSSAQNELVSLMRKAVERRLVADVPLGTFLSGGIDSSVVSALAMQQTGQLSTFSIGYADEPLYDETHYAELVAKKIGSDHHTFKLTNQDLFDHLFQMLDVLDEPFADSSALPVYILSRKTVKHVKVALSGDGADEVFSGYRKHQAHFYALQNTVAQKLIKHFGGLADFMPQSRQSAWANRFRQLSKLNKGLNLSDKERYLAWMSINNRAYADRLLVPKVERLAIESYESTLSDAIHRQFDNVLWSDVRWVLAQDMLVKVDKMSMANGLEVRAPFLDHEVVDWAFSLPTNFKIDANAKKKIVQDAFRSILPKALYHRPKHGFEVPLLNWFRNELHAYLFDELLNEKKIQSEGILNYSVIQQLKKQLMSSNPGDAPASLWALMVFQYWKEKNS
ncbi:MAG: asparagine synthase (glutamine-hydrolyzing) [Bacteroidales bacterium]|nr:asparagine synthase (glutamine-hydrolyzing) [Bacteroidales bacterium]